MEYLLDENGEKFLLKHGTNRKFDEHKSEKNRTILNNKYQGDWICYSPDDGVAWSYADAARNQSFNKEDFIEETNLVFSKIDNEAAEFMIDFTNCMLEGGYETGWDDAIKKYCDKHDLDPDGDGYQAFFKHINQYEKDLDFNINDFCDCVENVEYAKRDKPNSFDEVMSLFGGSSGPSVHSDDLDMLKRMGYDKIIHEPKIIESYVKFSKVLKTDNREKARNARENGYDLVIYSGEDCVQGIPEYLIANPNQIEMQTKVIRSFDYEDETWDGYTRTHYKYERQDVSKKENNELKKQRKIKP